MDGSVRSDGCGDEREGLRRRVVVATAMAVALGGGAAVAGCSPAPRTSAETPVSASLDPEERELERAVLAALDAMGLPKSSKAKVTVTDRQIIVVEECELVDGVVAERAFDRAEALAASVDATKADVITWVADNGKGAKAAVTVDADTSKVEKAAPKDVAAKLDAAVGYSLNDKAYEPVKKQVGNPSGGEVPKGADGKQLVTPAKADPEAVAAAASRKPAEKTADATNTATAATNDAAKQAADANANGKPVTEANANNNDNAAGGGSGGSSEAQLHWVEEQGHWVDDYRTERVWVGNHYVVDTAAWDEKIYEKVLVFACNCGYETTSSSDMRSHSEQHLDNGDGMVGMGQYYRNDLINTIRHDEIGHWEDDYADQQVPDGRHWVVDVPGHWE